MYLASTEGPVHIESLPLLPSWAHAVPVRQALKCMRMMQGLLQSWSNTTDPCDDGWAYVSCNCTDTYPEINSTECSAAEGNASSRRVLVLAVGGVIRTKGRQLYGTVPESIANLTELRTLDLHDNRLTVKPRLPTLAKACLEYLQAAC